MPGNKPIDEIFSRFAKITNGLSSLGDEIDNDQKNEESDTSSSQSLRGQGDHT